MKPCELCGREASPKLVKHHWDDSDRSKTVRVCRGKCHFFVECIDNVSGILINYVGLKIHLDAVFADQSSLISAKEDWDVQWFIASLSISKNPNSGEQKKYRNRYILRRYYVGTTICGERVFLGTGYKRPHPGGVDLLGMCELCGKVAELGYHHWGVDPNKGLWICTNCHMFAEFVDHVPNAFDVEKKYLSIKERREANL